MSHLKFNKNHSSFEFILQNTIKMKIYKYYS